MHQSIDNEVLINPRSTNSISHLLLTDSALYLSYRGTASRTRCPPIPPEFRACQQHIVIYLDISNLKEVSWNTTGYADLNMTTGESPTRDHMIENFLDMASGDSSFSDLTTAFLLTLAFDY